jgi:crossover junction endodeoxyribonuclease RuvC
MKSNKILGIDPGLNRTGWGIVESVNGNLVYLCCGTIKTSSKDDFSLRLLFIFKQICNIISQEKPNFAALEETYVNNNSKTSLHLAHARAAAMIAVAENNLALEPYQAKTIKKAITGSGNADKQQVEKMLKLRLKGLEAITDTDAIDALALAFCHANYLSI